MNLAKALGFFSAYCVFSAVTYLVFFARHDIGPLFTLAYTSGVTLTGIVLRWYLG
ncbi:MAG: hypothetical protein HGA85_02380 [Nanoarchaeota archaeon]|nr:hypothetical protein [Nanoarchaeota archaeon]